MDKEQSNKIMFIVIALVIILIIILMVMTIFGKTKTLNTSPGSQTAQNEYDKLNKSTTGKGSSSISDPIVQSLNKSTTGSKTVSGGISRDELNKATSGR